MDICRLKKTEQNMKAIGGSHFQQRLLTEIEKLRSRGSIMISFFPLGLSSQSENARFPGADEQLKKVVL